MTANQVAYQRAQEEARANRRQEELKAYEQSIKAQEARAASKNAEANLIKSLAANREATIKMDKLGSENFANTASGIGGILKSISAIASLFA